MEQRVERLNVHFAWQQTRPDKCGRQLSEGRECVCRSSKHSTSREHVDCVEWASVNTGGGQRSCLLRKNREGSAFRRRHDGAHGRIFFSVQLQQTQTLQNDPNCLQCSPLSTHIITQTVDAQVGRRASGNNDSWRPRESVSASH